MFNLVLADIETSHMASRKLGNLPSGPSHAAPNVQHAHAALDTNAGCEVVLVAGYGLSKALAARKAAEVEGFAPGMLENVRRQDVVLARHARVVLCSRLSFLFCLLLGRIGVLFSPVRKVLRRRGAVRGLVLA